jgi:4-nitrophenol 2-monooxygenase / 4-nitrocatechol 4-monooxygenase, reductase component
MSLVSSEEFRDLIGRFATGITIVTTFHDDTPYGTTASALTSVSLAPPTLLICMNKDSQTGQAIAQSRHFAVNVLAEDQGDLADRFAKRGSTFAGVPVTNGRRGSPLLTNALAVFECEVSDEIQAGTHYVFIARVDRATGTAGQPLAYFRGCKGGLKFLPPASQVAPAMAS